MPLIVVAPCSVIALEIVKPLVHVAAPEGSATVSPSFADATAAETSAKDKLWAGIVAPLVSRRLKPRRQVEMAQARRKKDGKRGRLGPGKRIDCCVL